MCRNRLCLPAGAMIKSAPAQRWLAISPPLKSLCSFEFCFTVVLRCRAERGVPQSRQEKFIASPLALVWSLLDADVGEGSRG